MHWWYVCTPLYLPCHRTDVHQSFGRAEDRLEDAEKCIQSGMLAEEKQDILSQIALVRANLVCFAGDLTHCVVLARQALDFLPEVEQFWCPIALMNESHSYLLNGDVRPSAERLIAEVAASAQSSNNPLAVLKSITLLAHVRMLQGRLHQAATTYEMATQLAPGPDELQVMIGSPAYYFGQGDLRREWNNLDEAERLLSQGMELVRGTLTVDAEVVLQGYTALTRLEMARGSSRRALATLEAFTQLANVRRFIPSLLHREGALRAWVELARGNLAAASRWVKECGLSPDDIDLSYPREREYLTLARVCIEEGRNDPVGAFLQDALHLLERLLQDAEAKSRMYSVLEILIVQALALYAQNDRKRALTTLERALILASPEEIYPPLR